MRDFCVLGYKVTLMVGNYKYLIVILIEQSEFCPSLVKSFF